MRLTIVSLLLCLASSAAPHARQDQARSTSRPGTDLLTLEALVLGADGRPVRDLQLTDFTVTIDGRPRKVLSARFAEPEWPRASNPGGGPDAGASYLDNVSAGHGRIVVFVVDRESIKSENDRTILETAGTILDSLAPADAVGVVGLPAGTLELTRDRDRARKALAPMTGTRPRQMMYADRNVSWDEALAYEQGNSRVTTEVVDRECAGEKPPEDGPPSRCPDQVRDQIREMLQVGRAHVQATLAAMGGLSDRLATVRGSKHMVLISGGLPFSQDLLPFFETFAKKAAEAQIVLDAVQLDQPSSNAGGKTVSSAFGARAMTQGLTTMTTATGGGLFNGITKGAGAPDRIRLEMNSAYALAVETMPEDGDGRARAIDVKVTRPGVTIRSRRQIALAPSSTRAPQDPLLALLQQPLDVPDLPLAVTAYSTHGDDDKTLRVVLSSEIGNSTARAPGEWGFVVLSESTVIASGRQKLDPAAPAPWRTAVATKIPPGRYRLRFAAADAGGTGGVVDVPLTIGLKPAGAIRMSDVMVGVVEGALLVPRARVPRGTPLAALVELLADDPAKLEKATASIEIAPAGSSAAPVQRMLMAARQGGSANILLNDAQVPTNDLAPGRYTATVVALIDDKPAGRVTRVFEVVVP